MNKETICAVVVTYNRKNLLLECLDGIRKQTRPVDAIYIIDNASTDGTPEILRGNGYIPELPPLNRLEPYEIEHQVNNLVDGNSIKIFYVRMHENTGGAGGFYEGVKRGYEKGYDWLWLMDDDVIPENNCLANLINLGKQESDILIVSPVKILPDGRVIGATLYHDLGNPFIRKIKYFKATKDELGNLPEYLEVNDVPFEGCLIKKKAILLSGYPLKNFFINYDDLEFCIRVKKFGKIVLSLHAVIEKRAFINYDPKVQLLREYYGYRNLTLIDRIHGKNLLVKYLRPIIYLLRVFFKKIITLKFKSLKLILLAFYDGYFLRLNKKSFNLFK
jgi:GT2 family glycosyltransferase